MAEEERRLLTASVAQVVLHGSQARAAHAERTVVVVAQVLAELLGLSHLATMLSFGSSLSLPFPQAQTRP